MDVGAIGGRIRSQRKLLELNLDQVAERLKSEGISVSVSHLSRVEAGKAGEPKISEMRALSRVLNVAWAWLIDGDSPKFAAAVGRFECDAGIAPALVQLSGWYQGATERERKVLGHNLSVLADALSRRGSIREVRENDFVEMVPR